MSPRLIVVVAASFLIGAGAALALFAYNAPQRITSVTSSGKALVGGPFSLVDHTGRRVTEKDFKGRLMLVFFGFTNCPDVCPAELQVMGAALDKLGDKAKEVVPVFVTVDPERDTAQQMASYISNFRPGFVGLTGTPEEIAAVAKTYRVYYARVKDEGSTAGYTMDHSAIAYLMDRQGDYAAHFAYGTDADAMAARIAGHL